MFPNITLVSFYYDFKENGIFSKDEGMKSGRVRVGERETVSSTYFPLQIPTVSWAEKPEASLFLLAQRGARLQLRPSPPENVRPDAE